MIRSRSGNEPRVLAVASACPTHTRGTAEILPLVEEWLKSEPERFRQKVLRLFRCSGVERRYSILSPGEVFSPASFVERNRLYLERMPALAEQALRAALEKAELSPQSLDAIITTSCTAIAIPALDVRLINRLRLRQDILRLPVFQMGCAGGLAGLIYARSLLQAHAARRVAVLAIESPTCTFQRHDLSMANMVSAALFGDGVACAILSNSDLPKTTLPVLLDGGMYHFFDEEALMGFQLNEQGLQMVLAPAVPEKIQLHLERIVLPFLERHALTVADVEQFLFHPGGRKILGLLDEWLAADGKQAPLSHQVLRDYGNMSSATILYVLEAAMNEAPAAGTYSLMAAFGPGFSAQQALLRWSSS